MLPNIGSGLPAQGTNFYDVATVIAEFLGPEEVMQLSTIPTCPEHATSVEYLRDSVATCAAIVGRSEEYVSDYDHLVEEMKGTQHGEPPFQVAAKASLAFSRLPPNDRTENRYEALANFTLAIDRGRAFAFPALARAFSTLLPAHRTLQRYSQFSNAVQGIRDEDGRALAVSALATSFSALSPAHRTKQLYSDVLRAALNSMIYDVRFSDMTVETQVIAYRAMHHEPSIRLHYDMLAHFVGAIADEEPRMRALPAQAAAFAAQDPALRTLSRYDAFELAVHNASSDETRAYAAVALASAYEALDPQLRTRGRYDLIVATVNGIQDEKHFVNALPALRPGFASLPGDRLVLEYDNLVARIAQIERLELRAIALQEQAHAFAALRPEDGTLQRYDAIAGVVQDVRGTRYFANALSGLAVAFAALRPEHATSDRYDAIVNASQAHGPGLLARLDALAECGPALAALRTTYRPPTQLAKLLSLHQIPHIARPTAAQSE